MSNVIPLFPAIPEKSGTREVKWDDPVHLGRRAVRSAAEVRVDQSPPPGQVVARTNAFPLTEYVEYGTPPQAPVAPAPEQPVIQQLNGELNSAA